MQSAQSVSTCIPPAILDNNQLIACVIEKHKKFIEDFSREYESLEKTVKEHSSRQQHITRELESHETRIVVLKEKRHQLYHQSKKLRMQILNEKLPRGSEINDLEERLQNSHLSSEEEFDCICKVISLFKEKISAASCDEEIYQRTVSSIINILETAKAAREELDTVMSTPDKLKNDISSFEKSLGEMESRSGWLNRRIDLHKKALDYWEKESKRSGSA